MLKLKGASEKGLGLFVLLKRADGVSFAISSKLAQEIGLGPKTVVIRAETLHEIYDELMLLVKEEYKDEYKEVRWQISELLRTKIFGPEKENVQAPISFSFFAKAKACACTMANACACKKAKEYVLSIESHIAKQVGLGLERLEIRKENPWAVYTALAPLIISAGIGTGT